MNTQAPAATEPSQPSQDPQKRKTGKPLRARATAAVLWASVRTWGVQFGALALFAVLARLLGPRDFGLVAVAAAYLDIADRLVEQGFASAIQQRRTLTDEHLNTAFWVNNIVAFLIIVVTLIGAPYLARLMDMPLLSPVLRVLSLTMVFTATRTVQDGILRRELRFKSLAARGIASVVCGGIVGVAMALAGYGVWSLVGQQLVWEASGVVVMWTAVKWRPSFHFSRELLGELWEVGGPITGSRLLNTTQKRAQDFIIGGGLGAVALGYFGVGQRIVTALNRMVSDAVNQVALPAFARVQHDNSRLIRAYAKATRYMAFTAFPTFIGIAAIAPEMIPLAFGPKWLPSVHVAQTMSIVGLIWFIWSFNSAVLQGVGAARVQFWLGLLGTTTNIIAILWALPYGIDMVAYAILAPSVIFSPLSTYVLHRYIGISVRELAAGFRAPFMASVMAYGAVSLVRLGLHAYGPLVVAVCGIAVAAPTYLGIVRLLSPDLMPELWSLARETLTRQRSLATGSV